MSDPKPESALDPDIEAVALQIVRDVAEMERPKRGPDVLQVTASALRLVVLNALEESGLVARTDEVRRLRDAVARVITLPTVGETELAAQANADAFLDECEDVPPHVERALRAALLTGFKAGTLWFAEKLLLSDTRLGTIR